MNDALVDVLVIAGNPGGCAAAIAAARSGASVMLLEATPVLGGMNANGTFGFDCATPQALSGIAEEVAARVKAHYARIGLEDPLFTKRADLVWESHVLAAVWLELAKETAGLRIELGAVPVGVRMNGQRIEAVQWQHACDPMGNLDPADEGVESVQARIVIDASYEADVTAWSGAPFRIGREARSADEPHAGKIFVSGSKLSDDGVLPHSVLAGSSGESDDAIMAFAYRLHCRLYADRSPGAKHRLRSPPPGYDPTVYRWEPAKTLPDGTPVYFDTLYVLVNGKYLLNRMVRGNNLVGPNRAYVLTHPRERAPLRQRFVDHALGYLYFVQTEGGMPELGLADDEFLDNGHLPYQIYVREGRRIVGRHGLSEADINPFIRGDGFRAPPHADAIAIGDWAIESQGCADEVPPGYSYPDGYMINRVARAPFQVPYRCLLPQGVDNLLTCGAISATHVAFGATRVEAVRIQSGIAAGVAAAMAVQGDCPPSSVPVEALQTEIIRRGGKLTYFADVPSDHPHFAAIQWAALRGLVPHDPDWYFHPDHPASWADFAQSIVTTQALPVSVTGAHFEGITRRHPCFRFVETLYDLSTRAGVDLFEVAKLHDEDPMQEFLRLEPRFKLLPFHPERAVSLAEAHKFLGLVAVALERSYELALVPPDAGFLTRAAMCEMLKGLWAARPAWG
ncbi:hypothetical protein C7T35_03180 [Variovorax sp. WS11]|uniref:FAD-dependent oxidoreductase n=1 Tax=Variovorax sp. WS11 TaxID=1105204 RepID=UPI000D0DFC2D|nr:FAD-dependent oxidoreductase [Variovorax sp. WS11]NDZ17451.1 FAD-dependent oxidoreductase [Variovorax sp. WS11]PSL86014.1 hypothetical protein C7T35_03180 [Variovorax sp. WS11]